MDLREVVEPMIHAKRLSFLGLDIAKTKAGPEECSCGVGGDGPFDF